MPKACPLCTAPASMLEQLAGFNRWFCNSCARVFEIAASGSVVKVAVTNHRPARSPMNGKKAP